MDFHLAADQVGSEFGVIVYWWGFSFEKSLPAFS